MKAKVIILPVPMYVHMCTRVKDRVKTFYLGLGVGAVGRRGGVSAEEVGVDAGLATLDEAAHVFFDLGVVARLVYGAAREEW